MLYLIGFAVLALTIAAVLGHAIANKSCQWLGPTLVQGNPSGNKIALTFDDGPGVETPAILDLLRQAGVRATFFLCGHNVERFPDHARRIAAEGHEIGNHTYSHPWLIGRTPGRIAYEVNRAQQVIARHTGREPCLFRPPHGLRWFGLFPILAQKQMTLAMWSVNGKDWKLSASRIADRVLQGVQPGSVILLHDGVAPRELGDRKNTVKALEKILPALTQQYKPVTVSEMFSATASADEPREPIPPRKPIFPNLI
ncbi:MAG: polysaccharide deacetylase family protein [Acidobacteria bacterium]|nr:polysaccharide deacetylase family protein [Acidobacteriota bacterium]